MTEASAAVADNRQDELLALERAHYKQYPQDMIHAGLLKIKTKVEGLKTLSLNNAQMIFLACLNKLVDEKKPVRVLLLKARQLGMSTLTEAILFCNTSQKEGINTLVIADDVKGSNYIFEMQKLFYEYLPEHLKPPIKHSNEKKLEFDAIHSQVLIDTAENKDVGRKMTLQNVHLSECAFFTDFNKIMLGLNQSVPSKPGTMIIIETTANGIGNSFYEMWQKAKKGESEWRCVFIGWHELPEYRLPLSGSNKDEFYPIDGISADKIKFLADEKKLKERFNLDDEQLNWRRWCIVNNCDGDTGLWAQEYPSDDVEAFLMSGSCYFDKEGLLKQEEKRRKWLEKNKVVIGNIVKFEGKYVFRESIDGRYRRYEAPDHDSTYVIGGDAAEGLPHGDDAAMSVLNKKFNRVAMVMNCTADTDELAEDMVKAGNYYNMAMAAPENKGYGSAVCKKVYASYGNVYRRVRDKTGAVDVSDELGWNTNVTSRSTMLTQLKEEIREGAIDILDEEILSQLQTFINDPKRKKPMAEKNKKDDLVFALAIAVMVRTYYPHVSRTAIEAARRNRMAASPQLVNQGYGFRKD